MTVRRRHFRFQHHHSREVVRVRLRVIEVVDRSGYLSQQFVERRQLQEFNMIWQYRSLV